MHRGGVLAVWGQASEARREKPMASSSCECSSGRLRDVSALFDAEVGVERLQRRVRDAVGLLHPYLTVAGAVVGGGQHEGAVTGVDIGDRLEVSTEHRMLSAITILDVLVDLS